MATDRHDFAIAQDLKTRATDISLKAEQLANTVDGSVSLLEVNSNLNIKIKIDLYKHVQPFAIQEK